MVSVNPEFWHGHIFFFCSRSTQDDAAILIIGNKFQDGDGGVGVGGVV